MSRLVLLDNTVLTNFALIDRAKLVIDVWPSAFTTTAVLAEYRAGTLTRNLPPHIWDEIPTVELTPIEKAFAEGLSKRLGAGERTCIAAAFHRNGLFVSDDSVARRQAQSRGIGVSGTVGVLILAVRQGKLTLLEGNELLKTLIQQGYRSPVEKLDLFL